VDLLGSFVDFAGWVAIFPRLSVEAVRVRAVCDVRDGTLNHIPTFRALGELMLLAS